MVFATIRLKFHLSVGGHIGMLINIGHGFFMSVALPMPRVTRRCLPWFGRLTVMLGGIGAIAGAMSSARAEVVEYYRPASNQYFLTGRIDEQRVLDGLVEFTRTGMHFSASAATVGAATDRLCRWRIELSAGANSHFYGLSGDCTYISQYRPANFFDEGADFLVTLLLANGQCPANASLPVYRAFRAQSALNIANHRYFVRRSTYDAAVRQGWLGEGAVFCVATASDEILSAAASSPSLTTGVALPALSGLPDNSTVPGTVELSLTAAPVKKTVLPGRSTEFWAYNGSVPGPLIEATEGDRVRVRFQNQLAQPSTIHWHGLPVPADQDGNPMDPVAPGSGRVYEFTLPEGSAGTYWYHPHAHGVTAEQVYRGLAGAFIVRPRVDTLPVTVREQVLMVTDLRLASDGSIPANTMMDSMNGREGQYVLVNGAMQPRLDMQPGETQRWKLFNASNARYLRIALDGTTFVQIGTDGGLLATPAPLASEMLLAPSERAEIWVRATVLANSEIALRALAYDRGAMGATASSVSLTLATVRVSPDSPLAEIGLPGQLREIESFAKTAATSQITRRLVLSENGNMGMAGSLLINGKSFDPGRVDTSVRVGTIERWDVENTSTMDHPFHVHGTQFQVVSRSRGGVVTPASFLSWKDTVNVPPGSSVSFLIRQNEVGKRMYHCHILEHEDAGMMGVLEALF